MSAGPAADLVIGLDSSTQSAKAIAWSRAGEAVAEGRAAIPMTNPQPGWAEQDPEDWWRSACEAFREVAAAVDPRRVAGLAIANQRETVGLFDAEGRASRPAILWLDERSRAELPRLDQDLGGERLHRITGKHADLTPCIYRLSWLRQHEPDRLDAADKILDVHGYLCRRLTGRAVASWTSADPFGVFDIAAKAWSTPLLDYLGLKAGQFAELEPPGALAGRLSEAAAAATGLAAGTPVYVAGGDGQCAGLGVNAVAPGTVYLNLGTALITGAWSETPRIGLFWRTLTSPTGEGYFLEGCLRAGTYFVDWFLDTIAGGRATEGIFERLEAAAAALPVGSDGVLVSPYLSGCMDPHWDPDARAAFLGLAPYHGQGHLYRAILEAMTLESARCMAAMEADGLAPRRVIAVGGGANSALWTRMLADASGLPITRAESLEASALGAGMTAAVGAGWYPDFATAAASMSRLAETTVPDAAARAAWDALSARQAQAYRPGGL